jgi:hypothetical protein
MKRLLASCRRALLPLALLSLGACTGLGGLGGPRGPGGGDVRGRVARVDDRRQEIGVRRSYGSSVAAYYDGRTDVVYRNRRYSVRALEPGDVVTMRLDRGRRGEPYARQIYVERSVRDDRRDDRRNDRRDDRRDDRRGVQRFEGRVGRVDARRGSFQLRGEYGGDFTVTLPSRARSADYDRLRRLRPGTHVRIEGQLVDNRRIVLVRFR